MKRLSIYVVTVCAVLVLSITGVVLARSIGKRGTTPYVTHFVFRPLVSIDIPGLGTATALEMTGTTENMEGGTMLHQMSARCVALNVASGDTKYLDGACVLVDRDGDKIMSRFDSREVDKSFGSIVSITSLINFLNLSRSLGSSLLSCKNESWLIDTLPSNLSS